MCMIAESLTFQHAVFLFIAMQHCARSVSATDVLAASRATTPEQVAGDVSRCPASANISPACICFEASLSVIAYFALTYALRPSLAGIMSNIFDGIQRPLKTIAKVSGDCFIPRGINVPSLDVVQEWEFRPTSFKVSLRHIWFYTGKV